MSSSLKSSINSLYFNKLKKVFMNIYYTVIKSRTRPDTIFSIYAALNYTALNPRVLQAFHRPGGPTLRQSCKVQKCEHSLLSDA